MTASQQFLGCADLAYQKGNFCRYFQCGRYYFNSLQTIYFQKKRPRGRAVSAPDFGHGFAGSNPAGGQILPEPKRRFIAQSLSCSPFHRLEMTEILLKGRKILTHPSIQKDTTNYTIYFNM